MTQYTVATAEQAARRRMRLNRLWKRGADEGQLGPVFVSMNDYWVDRWRDVPKIALVGMRFRRTWPRMDGAVGLWFAAYKRGRRQVSVSIWRRPEDLRRFVDSPVHRRVMHDFRDAGSLYTTTWNSGEPGRHLIWKQAEDRLMGRVDGVPHH